MLSLRHSGICISRNSLLSISLESLKIEEAIACIIFQSSRVLSCGRLAWNILLVSCKKQVFFAMELYNDWPQILLRWANCSCNGDLISVRRQSFDFVKSENYLIIPLCSVQKLMMYACTQTLGIMQE